jgi:UDP-glucose 4-epimerase
MKVVVTGGAGFIGSHVIDRLLEYGVTPRIFDQRASTYHPNVEHHLGSLLDLPNVRIALAGADAVIHLAAVADVKDVFENPVSSEQINSRGTLNVLEAARQTGVQRVVYGSTTWVYSDCAETNVDENTMLAPPSHLYSTTKLTGENYCRSYSALYDVDYTILRFGIPYGPRARDGAVVPIFTRKALNGEALTVAGDGLQFRKFVYVEDLAEGNVLALKPNAKNRTYNLDGAEKVSILQIAETIKGVVGDVTIEHTEARPGDFGGKEVDSNRAEAELGWKASTPFAEGVRRYVEWYKTRQQNRTDSMDKVNASLLEAGPLRGAA